jgi:predicted dehydrogenase
LTRCALRTTFVGQTIECRGVVAEEKMEPAVQSPGVAIVGAGTIVEHAHLPAYSAAGIRVVSILDEDNARAEKLASRFGLRVAGSIEEICEDRDVSIVDIAVTPTAQIGLALAAVDAGKHVLCQKPLAPSLQQAREMVEAAAGSPVVRAVNQQMRWEPGVAAARRLLETGALGAPVAFVIETNLNADFPRDHWLSREPRLMGLYGAIHNFDSARALFGEPEAVTARLLRDPLQQPVGEMWINAWLEWAEGPTMVLFERYTNWAADQVAVMRVEGTQATLRGRFGLWDHYPTPAPSHVEWKRHDSDEWIVLSSTATWLPDAFSGPMTAMLHSIETGAAHPTSWADHLKTLAIVEAMYESSQSRRTIRLDEKAAG